MIATLTPPHTPDATTGGTPLRVRQMPAEGDPPAALVSPQGAGSPLSPPLGKGRGA